MQSPRMATLCAYPVIRVPLSCGGVVAKESSLRGRTRNGPQLLLSPPSPPSPPPPKPTAFPTRICGRQFSPYDPLLRLVTNSSKQITRTRSNRQINPEYLGQSPRSRKLQHTFARYLRTTTSCKSVLAGALGPRLSRLGNGCNLLLFWDRLCLHTDSPAAFSRWRGHHAELSMIHCF